MPTGSVSLEFTEGDGLGDGRVMSVLFMGRTQPGHTVGGYLGLCPLST